MIYEFRSGYFEWVKCLKFDFPKSIRAGKENIYILNENDLFIIAKTNFQIRRIFKCISANPLEIAVDSKEENVFILDTQEKQIYQVSILDNAVYTLLTDEEKRNAISNALSIFVGNKDNKIYVLDSIKQKSDCISILIMYKAIILKKKQNLIFCLWRVLQNLYLLMWRYVIERIYL